MSAKDLPAVYLRDIIRTFKNYRTLGERALAQVSDTHLHTLIDAESNSIAIIVSHLSGNLRSRFTDLLTTDGEKPDRDRDAEFETYRQASRDELLRSWDAAWTIALASIESLTPDDLGRTITIRSEPFLVLESLNRLATHTSYHVGQMVFLAKHFAGPAWSSLSIPKRRKDGSQS